MTRSPFASPFPFLSRVSHLNQCKDVHRRCPLLYRASFFFSFFLSFKIPYHTTIPCLASLVPVSCPISLIPTPNPASLITALGVALHHNHHSITRKPNPHFMPKGVFAKTSREASREASTANRRLASDKNRRKEKERSRTADADAKALSDRDIVT